MSKVPFLMGRRAQGRAKAPKGWEVVCLSDGRPAIGEGLRSEIRARRQEIVAKGGDGYEEVRYSEDCENSYRFDPGAPKMQARVAAENARRNEGAVNAAAEAERTAAAAALDAALRRAAAAGVPVPVPVAAAVEPAREEETEGDATAVGTDDEETE